MMFVFFSVVRNTSTDTTAVLYHCPVVWDLCIHFIYIELFQDTKVGVGLFRCQMTHCLQYM